MKTISIIHPSRSRPDLAIETATKWIERAGTHVEYILCLDKDDIHNYAHKYQTLSRRDDCNFWVAEPLNHKSAIEAINWGAKQCKGDIIVVVSDDFDCPENWAIQLLDSLKGKSDFLVKTQDGIQPTLITLPIMDRVYYERFGYVYHPGYKHMFCDTEMTAVGEMTGKVISLPILFSHNHYTIGAMKKDAVNAKNDATWSQGQKLFNQRKAINFGLEHKDIAKPYSAIKWK